VGICLFTEERFGDKWSTICVKCKLNCVAHKFIEAKLSRRHEVSSVWELRPSPDMKGECEYIL